MDYEEHIVEIEGAVFPSKASLEAAADALGFVHTLNEALRENGADLPEEPDVDKLGSTLDGVFAELAAASIFLSENTFARVPKMLRTISAAFDKADTRFLDPTGSAGPSVPAVLVKGYKDLARRIEVARVQQADLLGELKKYEDSQETP